MNWTEILKTYGPGGVAIVLVAWLVRFMAITARDVGRELITSIKALSQDIRDHTEVDLQHHARVAEAIVRVEAKVDARDIRDLTPVRGVPLPAADEEDTPLESPHAFEEASRPAGLPKPKRRLGTYSRLRTNREED